MLKYENHCVNCPPEMGCLGKSCPNIDVPVYCCDICGEEGAEYEIENNDLCKDCAKEYMNMRFAELTIEEKERALNVTVNELLQEEFDDMLMSEQAETLKLSFYER